MSFRNHIVAVAIVSALFITTSIGGCSAIDNFIGMPSVSIDDSGLGDSQIGKILKQDMLWTGGERYNNDGNISPNDPIYPLLTQTIAEINAKGLNTEQTLNQSNLGVQCKDSVCKYQGIYNRVFHNVPNKVSANGKISSKINKAETVQITIEFNPKALPQTYRISQFILNKG